MLIISSSQISCAKKNDKEEDDGKDLKKDTPVSPVDKTKKINRDLILLIIILLNLRILKNGC
jgi:hypothetical protein